MSLQLSSQSTSIHIFNIVSLGRGLWFGVVAEIVMHTLYMIQGDYILIM